ncbi:phage tail protein [Cellulomonas alba]|uniref:Tail fiber protein n=1 Tax=Cellulomonas alba TaxID=3053467 RepID=A0ABT7SH34_9CELL|nr:tail fiber protein [Cellulomonas alba]MDM7855480.1 tail fiber protein [Cellulomonas alba]
MSDQFLGEIRIFAGNFAPQGWATCDGQLLPISQNTALFSLLGVNYGGNGTSNFALPDLIGRSPLGVGSGPGLSDVTWGEQVGVPTVTLLASEMPAHTHQVRTVAAGTSGTTGNPSGASWAQSRQGRVVEAQYATATPSAQLAPTAVAPTGNGQPHNNLAPYLAVTFIIALQGIYPQRP